MIIVVGIGADGMAGLAPASRGRIAQRHSDLRLAATARPARRERPRGPAAVAVPDAARAAHAARRCRGDIHVVASGDPLLHGIGGTLIRLYGADRVAGAAARLLGDAGVLRGWAGQSRTPRSSAW